MGDHYLPRFYLKGFTSDECLWVYDQHKTLPFKSSPKSVANENNMYGEEIEQLLANQVEEPAKLAIEKIRKGHLPNAKDREFLARYIINLWKRVPNGRDRVAARMPEVAEAVRKELHFTLDHLAQLGSEEEKQAHIKRKQIDEVLNQYIRTTPPEIWQASLIKGSSGQPESVLLDMNWHFLQSRDENFLTSDNPVFFFEQEGMGSDKAELTLPLSSKVCLWAHKLGNKYPDFYEAKPIAIKSINRRVAYNATRFVYSAREASWIMPFVKKAKSHEINRLTFL